MVTSPLSQEDTSINKDTMLRQLKIEEDPVQFNCDLSAGLHDTLYVAIVHLCSEVDLSWVDYLPALMFNYKSPYNSKLKQVPFMTMFSREPKQWGNQKPSVADDLPHLKNNRFLKTSSFIKAKKRANQTARGQSVKLETRR